jgi:dihydrolipoamide dehydrogenase
MFCNKLARAESCIDIHFERGGKNMSEKYNLIVIGSGPGGYVAAIRAAQLGLKTAIVEREYIGGVCLNWGCIPSKTLLYATELKRTLAAAGRAGVVAENVSIDIDKLRRHKETTVKRLTGGVKLLLEKSGVAIIDGEAAFASPKTIKVKKGDSRSELSADNFIIATGASPFDLPMIPVDGRVVIGAREAIDLPRIPKNMLVIGAGPIGVEIGSVYQTLGAKVTIVELLDAVLPMLDADVSSAAQAALKKQGLEIFLSSKVTSSKRKGDTIDVTFETPDGAKTMNFDLVLVSAGMKPNTNSLGLDKAGVELDGKGFIKVDRTMKTSAAGIYAIGDVTGGLLLAHKASHEGVAAAEAAAGQAHAADWKAVPYAVFIEPEVAGIGLTEKEAVQAGRKIKIGKFPLGAVGKAVATLSADGFAKVICDAETDAILGIHLVGSHAGDIIFAGTTLLEMDGTAEDLGHMMAVHPTISEALMEAGLHVNKKAIHIVN